MSSPRISPFVPKSITCLLEGYSKEIFLSDLIAGISVGVIALPLAMAFAIAAGLDPEYGIYTAIVAGFLTSLLGGGRFLIGGPTGAYVLLIYTVFSVHGLDGLRMATLEAGIILIILGVLRMGGVIRFVPYPVIVGFTGGIALTLFISQLKDFFGLQIASQSIDPVDRIHALFRHIHTISWASLAIGALTIGAIFTIRRFSKKLPAFIIALAGAAIVTWIFGLDTPTIKDKFGIIPSELPSLQIPEWDFDTARRVFPEALAIALLGAIESLLCAVIADSITGTTHKSNCELVAQGIANIGSTLFGGIPATGAIARTNANIQFGARTPFAGIFHAITLLLLVYFIAPLASMVPLAALSGVLLVVAWNMCEFDHMKELLVASRSEAITMVITLLTTLFAGLNTAIEVGVLLSIILFVKKSSEMSKGKLWAKIQKEEAKHDREIVTIPYDGNQLKEMLHHDVYVYELEGPFFFAVSDMLNDAFNRFETMPKTLIIRMRSVPFIDSTGIQALKRFAARCKSKGVDLYIAEARAGIVREFERTSLLHTLPKEKIVSSILDVIH